MSASQMAQLNEQFAILQANLAEFDGLIKDVSVQYQSLQDLAIMHGSMFMASQTVFGNNYNMEEERP
ncbi:hypothetical protein PUMCH_000702 [Australozyma saopauloensis]|uniref:Uncharacterized protein n=1 Tax=Australozyma saopauloensis TaxID=291208 RepID=A0AAX4H4J6_9ASCO|nr:hypothetical protein PUMCH_000702 [[Candida] saopauloensis]